MLGRRFSYLVFLCGTQALPRSFVRDLSSIDGTVLDLPRIPLVDTPSHAFNWPTADPTASAATTTFAPTSYLASKPSIAKSSVIANISSSRTYVPTATVKATLSNSTFRPTSTSERNDDHGSMTDDELDATPFDTATTGPLSKWPHWFTAATFSLVFYDILTLGLFLWLWVFGYLWWFGRAGDRNRSGWRRRGISGEVAMSRMGMPARYGDSGRYEGEWVRSTRYGRTRSESEQRARSARDAELEGEMRRLGMI